MLTQQFIQVKASAGSGKTYALTSQFLALLHKASHQTETFVCTKNPGAEGVGYALPEIMAVTFTNKAAAEMKERVVSTLKRRALGLDATGPAADWTPQEASRWLSHIVRHYHQLNIRTIDSFLHLVMRLFAVESGLAPDFTVFFDIKDIYPVLYESLMQDSTQEDPSGNPSGTSIQQALDTAFDSLLSLEEKKGFFLDTAFDQRLLKLLHFHLEARQEKNSRAVETDPVRIHNALKRHCQHLNTASKAMQKVLDCQQYATKKHFHNLLDKCTALTVRDPLPTSTYAYKADLAQCLNKASQESVTPACQAVYETLKKCFAHYETVHPLLTGARDLSGFLPVTDLLIQELKAYEQEHNTLLLSQCARRTAHLLHGDFGVPDAFCRMGARLKHILLDEFQDTDKQQWEALLPLAVESLSRGGTVFYVGDVRQAIYGWRGGDAQLFDAVAENEELTCMAQPVRRPLRFNWRSMRHIVEWNNEVFGQLEEPQKARDIASALLGPAPEKEKELLADKIQQAFAQSIQELPADSQQKAGYVRIHKVSASNKAAMMEEARTVLESLFSRELAARSPGDIAVLVRSNQEGAEVARWLIELGWPVVTKNSLHLADHPIVSQLVSLLRFLDYPADDIALWEFVSGQDIFGKATGTTRQHLAQWLAGETKIPLYPRFEKAFPREYNTHIKKFLQHAGFMSAYDMVCEIIAHFQLLENARQQELFIRRFLEVVHTAEQAGHQSLSCFLRYWEQSAAEEKVPLPEHIDAVRIMTIHDAKGLEFPVVLVPFHHWQSKPHKEYTLYDIDDMHLFVPLRKELGTRYYEQFSTALLEQLNLLYVAWTRPVEELYCLLTTTTKSRPFSTALAALLQKQFPADSEKTVAEYGKRPAKYAEAAVSSSPTPTEKKGLQPLTVPSASPPAASIASMTSAPPHRPPPDTKPMDWLPRLKIHRYFSNNLSRDELLGLSCTPDAFSQRIRGQLIHTALETLHTVMRYKPDQSACITTAIQSAMQQYRHLLPPKQHEQIHADCNRLLTWLFTLPDLPDWIRQGEPECCLIDSNGMEHRPDLLVWENKTATIVEYKTGTPLPEHQQQVRRYLKLLAAMPQGPRKLSGLLIYLDKQTTQPVGMAAE